MLLTDLVIPGMNGKELANRIGTLRPGIAVVYMSGYTADIIAQQGVTDSEVHFLQKPFSREELARKLQEALRTSSPLPRGPSTG